MNCFSKDKQIAASYNGGMIFFFFSFFFLFFCARVGLRPRTVHSVGNPVQPIFLATFYRYRYFKTFVKLIALPNLSVWAYMINISSRRFIRNTLSVGSWDESSICDSGVHRVRFEHKPLKIRKNLIKT